MGEGEKRRVTRNNVLQLVSADHVHSEGYQQELPDNKQITLYNRTSYAVGCRQKERWRASMARNGGKYGACGCRCSHLIPVKEAICGHVLVLIYFSFFLSLS